MIHDTCKLVVSGNEYSGIKSYEIGSDLYGISDSFSITACSPDYDYERISPGDWVSVYIGNERVMYGCITRISENYSKSNVEYVLSGYDICGMLNIAQCSKYETFSNSSVLDIALAMTSHLNWKKRLQFRVDSGAILRGKFVVEPGNSVAERLTNLAVMSGVTMFAESSGVIVFGRIVSGGKPVHSLVVGSDMVVSFGRDRSIENGGSTVTVCSLDDGDAGSVSRSMVVIPEFPAIDLPCYVVIDSGDTSSKKISLSRANEVRRDLLSISATVVGHRSSTGKLWAVNQLCTVTHKGDTKILVCIRRVFRKSKSEGTITELVFGLPEMRG